MSKLLERITNTVLGQPANKNLTEEIFKKIRKIESKYLKPQNFRKYGNYWLPQEVVETSKNVLSFGVHTDIRWEQAMCRNNPNLNIYCYDPTPCSVDFFQTDFLNKENIKYHPIAYAKKNGKMKFYYGLDTRCFSLIPYKHFGENPSFIEVETKNLVTIMKDDMPQVDIIKADIEGVWYDVCREILDNNIDFKVFLIEFEIDTLENVKRYESLLKEFKRKGYKLYLNRPREKNISEAVIIK